MMLYTYTVIYFVWFRNVLPDLGTLNQLGNACCLSLMGSFYGNTPPFLLMGVVEHCNGYIF